MKPKEGYLRGGSGSGGKSSKRYSKLLVKRPQNNPPLPPTQIQKLEEKNSNEGNFTLSNQNTTKPQKLKQYNSGTETYR